MTSKNQQIWPKPSDLMRYQAHLGSKHWDPSISQNLIGFRDKTGIIDLNQTCVDLKRAYTFISNCTSIGGKLMVVNTNPFLEEYVIRVARTNEYAYLNGRWIGGLLTNWSMVGRSVFGFKDFCNKYESLMNSQDINLSKFTKFKKAFSGLTTLNNLPDVILVMSAESTLPCIVEANAMNIPVVGFTSSSSNGLDYPIVVNNKSVDFSVYALNLLDAINNT